MTVSSGGKIVIAFGAFLMIGAAFIVSSPLIAIVVFIMGIIAVIRGYGMKQGPPAPIRSSSRTSQQSGKSQYDTGLSSKKDPTSKGAV